MQNKKLMTIPILLLLALVITGFAYSHYQQVLTIGGTINTSELDIEILPGSVTSKDDGLDWTVESTCTPPKIIMPPTQLDKNVGSTTSLLKDTDGDGDLDKLELTIDNVYPCYYNHIDFWVHNNGELAWKITKVIVNDGYADHEYTDTFTDCFDLDDDGKCDIVLRWGDSFNLQKEYCEELNISFDFHIVQDAPQDETLTFTIKIVAVQCLEH
jgi:hypothetical protein